MKLLADPRIFSFVIMALYTLNSIRFAWAGRWWDAGYWVCAFGITATVTFRPGSCAH